MHLTRTPGAIAVPAVTGQAEAELLADRAVCDHPAVAEYLREWRAGRCSLPEALLYALRQTTHLNNLLLIRVATAAGPGPPPTVPGAKGHVCPTCLVRLRTIKTYHLRGGVVSRRKRCPGCGHRIATHERAVGMLVPPGC